jgi:nitric oxide reductase NorE protein
MAVKDAARDLNQLRAYRFGTALFLFTQLIHFLVLVMAKYLFLGTYKSARLNPWMGLAETLLVIVAGYMVWEGFEAVRRHDLAEALMAGFRRGLVLGLAALLILAYQWSTHFVPPELRFGEIYYTMTGVAAFYLGVGMVALWIMLIRGRNVGFSAARCWDAEAAAYLWTFSCLMWVVVYITLYWI